MKNKKRNIIIIAAIGLVMLIAGLIIPGEVASTRTHTINNGSFEVVVQSKGELKGEKMMYITLPEELTRRELRLYRLEIEDLVPEGTIVEEGGYVARIDRQAIEESMKRNKNQLDDSEARLKDARIDSTIQLSKAREAIRKAEINLEEKQYDLDLAKYESEAYKRQSEIAYNKAKRSFGKAQRDMELNRINLSVRVRRDEMRFDAYKKRHERYLKALGAIEIKAPSKGMVMYARRWNGKKIKVGDHVNMYEQEIASLPDLSHLVSESYVLEIDIAKINVGDSVSVMVDAMPDNAYYGKVLRIANVGQEISGEDTKVFKVLTRLEKTDQSLKPYMTTNNQIYSASYSDTLIIPLEYVFSNDQFQFVYLKDGSDIYRQEIKLGNENEETAIIKEGLTKGDVVLCNQPDDISNIEVRRL